jgi:hypothetical protein
MELYTCFIRFESMNREGSFRVRRRVNVKAHCCHDCLNKVKAVSRRGWIVLLLFLLLPFAMFLYLGF